jgi:hypothetical protein
MRKRARISLGGSEQVYGRFCRIRSWFERGRQECPEYAAEVETVLETFAPADPRSWSGTFGRQLPGTAASRQTQPRATLIYAPRHGKTLSNQGFLAAFS